MKFNCAQDCSWHFAGDYYYEENYKTGEMTGRIINVEDILECGCYSIREDDEPGMVNLFPCELHSQIWPDNIILISLSA